jgi:hypothetical protein
MKKIIIPCPYFETGGPEALHQLCDAINNLGGNAYIYYNERNNQVHPAYQNYNIKLIDNIEDKEDHVMVIPEGNSQILKEFKNAELYFWWLSVDYNNFNQYGNEFSDIKINHLAQSYYALNHLIQNKALKYLPLFDYINEIFIKESNQEVPKQDIICFNPRKNVNLQLINEIALNIPNAKFIPLTNMSKNELINTLKSSKIYLDFGIHPGKDRPPREAALMNNIIISSCNGSAAFYSDIPIDPSKYKLDTYDSQKIINEIRNNLMNYESNIKDFNLYKNVIKNQKQEFINQANQIFAKYF